MHYEAQLDRVRAILAVFDAPTFSDTDPKTRETVVALMAEGGFLLFLPSSLSVLFLVPHSYS